MGHSAILTTLKYQHTYFLYSLHGLHLHIISLMYLCSPVHRYFTNISIGGRDYSFNSDGYLSKPLLDVISYTNGRGWEEVSTHLCKLALIIIVQRLDHLTAISHPIKHANSSLLSFTFLLSHSPPCGFN